MSETNVPKILITGATGQVGSKVINYIINSDEASNVEIVAAVR